MDRTCVEAAVAFRNIPTAPVFAWNGWVKLTKHIIHIKTEQIFESGNPQITNIYQFFNGKNPKFYKP
jgi:hypothetical protein